jgi:hypothetical protein
LLFTRGRSRKVTESWQAGVMSLIIPGVLLSLECQTRGRFCSISISGEDAWNSSTSTEELFISFPLQLSIQGISATSQRSDSTGAPFIIISMPCQSPPSNTISESRAVQRYPDHHTPAVREPCGRHRWLHSCLSQSPMSCLLRQIWTQSSPVGVQDETRSVPACCHHRNPNDAVLGFPYDLERRPSSCAE